VSEAQSAILRHRYEIATVRAFVPAKLMDFVLRQDARRNLY
jgi:hypothetical protein